MGSYKLRGTAWAVFVGSSQLTRGTVWAVFVGSYKLTWHSVGGVCGELQTDVARCGWSLWGVTS